MNSPTPGWHPDPTARHDYRYWDGWEWTDDVADGGLTGYDPLPADDGYSGYGRETEATRRYTGYDSYQGYGPQAGYDSQPGYGSYESYGNGAAPPTRRVPDLSYQPPYYTTDDDTLGAAKKGPSARLLVGVGLVAVAMVAGLVFVLVSSGRGGDDQADGTEISDRGDRGERPSGGSTNAGDTPSSSDTTAPGGPTSTTAAPGNQGNPGTTAPGGPGATGPPGGPGTTAAPPSGGGGGSGGSGGSGDEAAVVDQLAQMFHDSSGGAMSEEQSRCMAQGMVDAIGVEGAQALTGGGGAMPPALTPEQQQELQSLAMDCGMGG